MDKCEQRRLRLVEIGDRFCNEKTSELAHRIEREPSYVSRMLCPEGKNEKKRIADNMMELIEKSFSLLRGWMGMLADGKAEAINHLGSADNVRAGFVPIIGEVVLGVDGSIDMTEFRSGWLSIYSSDRDACGLKVKGNSIWPRIQSGECVVIEPNTPAHPGDEVFVGIKDDHNMIETMNKTRDDDYQSSSVNSDYRSITLPVEEADKMHFVSVTMKHTKYVDQDDLPKV